MSTEFRLKSMGNSILRLSQFVEVSFMMMQSDFFSGQWTKQHKCSAIFYF